MTRSVSRLLTSLTDSHGEICHRGVLFTPDRGHGRALYMGQVNQKGFRSVVVELNDPLDAHPIMRQYVRCSQADVDNICDSESEHSNGQQN